SAVAINKNGQVTGTSETSTRVQHAFLWQSGVMRDLGTLGTESYAGGINDTGAIIGATSFGGGNPNQAFIWTSAQTFVALPSLGVVLARAFDLNNRGQGVGWALGQDQQAYPVLW